MPDNASSFHHVKAFKLEFYNWNKAGKVEDLVSCHIFNLTAAKWRERDVQLVYSFVHPRPGQYEVVLSSLPHPGRGFRGSSKYRLVNAFDQDFNNQAALWSSEVLTIDPQSCQQTIHVSFTAPPSVFDFNTFTIDLYGDKYVNYIAHKQIKWFGEEMISVEFTDISVAKYDYLHIVFVPEHHSDCKCKLFAIGYCDIPGGTELQCCRCRPQRSYDFKWSDDNCNLPYFPTTQLIKTLQLSMTTIVLIFIAAIFIPSVVILGLFMHKQSLCKRSVLVVYDALDSDAHTATVNALAEVIKACKLGIIEQYNIFQADSPDLISYDIILFINSDNIVRNLARIPEENETDVPPIFDFLKGRLKEPNRIRCVQFDYTNGRPKIPHLDQEDSNCSLRTFSIPKDIKLLLRWMDGKLPIHPKLDTLPQMKTLSHYVNKMTDEIARQKAEFARQNSESAEINRYSESGYHSNRPNFLQPSSVSAVVKLNEAIARHDGEEETRFDDERAPLTHSIPGCDYEGLYDQQATYHERASIHEQQYDSRTLAIHYV